MALRLAPLCEALPKKKISLITEDQPLRSRFSVRVTDRPACNAQTKESFLYTLCISLEENDESVFWLEMGRDTNLLPRLKPEHRIFEALERIEIQKLQEW